MDDQDAHGGLRRSADEANLSANEGTQPRPTKRGRGGDGAATSGTTSRGARSGDKTSRKPPLSCGECRRLKLKCDRVFPCQSCVKRGCAGICPDGALTSGKGSRYILANTEQLHEKISEMSDRIRQLEEALGSLQSRFSSSSHPLLRAELLLIKNSMELYGLDQNGNPIGHASAGNGTNGSAPAGPSRGTDGEEEGDAREGGDARDRLGIPISSARNEPMREQQLMGPGMRPDLMVPMEFPRKDNAPDNHGIELPSDLAHLSRYFPFPWSPQLDRNMLRSRIRDLLPPRHEAEYLCDQARQNALWQYTHTTDSTFLPSLIQEVYAAPVPSLRPRRLALLYIFLALGSSVDLQRPAEHPDSERYYHLSRAALCEVPVCEEVDITIVQTLFIMSWYLLILKKHKVDPVHTAWVLMGLNAKLLQSLNLHRENPALKEPDKQQEQRTLLWEIINLDVRLSLRLGKPPSFSLQHIDVPLPRFPVEGNHLWQPIDAMFYNWKHTFLKDCLSPVLEMAVTARRPDYSAVLRQDTLIRDFHVESALKMDLKNTNPPNGVPTVTGASRMLIMRQAIVSSGTDTVILMLHRGHLAQLLAEAQKTSPMSHPYAPSVAATYISACNLITSLEVAYAHEPALTSRFGMFWANAFSGCVALCLLVSRAPCCTLTPSALDHLTKANELFNRASTICPNAAQTLAILQDLVTKTQDKWKTAAVNKALGKPEPERMSNGLGLPGKNAVDALIDNWDSAHPSLRALRNMDPDAAPWRPPSASGSSTTAFSPVADGSPNLLPGQSQQHPSRPVGAPSSTPSLWPQLPPLSSVAPPIAAGTPDQPWQPQHAGTADPLADLLEYLQSGFNSSVPTQPWNMANALSTNVYPPPPDQHQPGFMGQQQPQSMHMTSAADGWMHFF